MNVSLPKMPTVRRSGRASSGGANSSLQPTVATAISLSPERGYLAVNKCARGCTSGQVAPQTKAGRERSDKEGARCCGLTHSGICRSAAAPSPLRSENEAIMLVQGSRSYFSEKGGKRKIKNGRSFPSDNGKTNKRPLIDR